MTLPVPPAYPQPTPLPRRRVVPLNVVIFIVIVSVVVTALVTGLLVRGLGDSADSSSTTSNSSASGPQAAAPPIDYSAEPEPEVVPFTPKDFKLSVKVLSKECFDSYGCNVTFRIIPEYVGSALDFEERTAEISYRVTGMENEATNTFTMTNGEYYKYELEHFGTVPTSSAKISAKVTEVTE